MKQPLALTLIAALALSACATPPPPGVPVGYLIGSLGYEPEGRKLEKAQLKICDDDRKIVADLSYQPRRYAPGAIDQPGFAGASFVVALSPGTYYFCGSDFAEQITDPGARDIYPSVAEQAGDAAWAGLKVVGIVAAVPLVVVGTTYLYLVTGREGLRPFSSASSASSAPRADRLNVPLSVEEGKLSYIGRYRGFQVPPTVGKEGISTWVVTDQQAEDLISVLKQRPELTDLSIVKALPSTDLPAGWQLKK